MSKADISTTLIRSRRAVLAGIASAAALPIAAAASSTVALPTPSAADPFFAAIDAYRRVDAEYMAHKGPEDIPDELCDRHSDAFDAVLQTRPTTLAGLVALTTFVRDWTDYLLPHSELSGEMLCTLAAAIDDAAKALIGRQA
jgi:NADPH-dependent 2,4-dienoyl-CoA reductase/sulfur reductase-like enzyme